LRISNSAFYWLGPVRLSIYARIELSNGAEVAVTTEFQEADELEAGRWGWSECAGGGRAGFGKGFIRASLSMGGRADILFFLADLGADIRFMGVEAGFSGELLEEGFGKEAVIGIEGIWGHVVGTVYSRRFHCWWSCCHHCCVWGSCWCCCWTLNCNSWWSLDWQVEILKSQLPIKLPI
jgi:hypothetical protein